MRKFFFYTVLIFSLVGLLQMQSCRQDDFDTSPALRLDFSVDSLLFDTVFTTVGSSTRHFKVYNRNNARVNISSLELAGGANSYFRMNVDGRSGTRLQNIEIGPRDSLYVFIEVTVDPTGDDLPLVIADSVVFDLNQNLQDVKLVAWGQDAHFIRPNVRDTLLGLDYHLLTENTVWSGTKPRVIYGLLLVAPDVSLRIEEGVGVHFHHQSAMIFLRDASLQVEGSREHPVVIQGDRMESNYRNRPGQWGYIWLTAESKNHSIDYAVIKNGTYGIVMDSIGSTSEPTLLIRNTIIKNMDQTGLEMRGAWVDAENLVVANCGMHAIYMGLGGRYEFRHTTVANYYVQQGNIRQTPSVVFNNYYLDQQGNVQVREFYQARFVNSIIYGSLQEELAVDLYPGPAVANFSFENSLIRSRVQINLPDLFVRSIFNEQPGFHAVANSDFRLRENSPAIGLGNTETGLLVPYDILGNSRSKGVDAGAYQYYEIEEEEE